MASKRSGSPSRRRGKRRTAPSNGFRDWKSGNVTNFVHSDEIVEISDEDIASPFSENVFADRDENVAYQSVFTFSNDEYAALPFASKSDEGKDDVATTSTSSPQRNSNVAVVALPNSEKVESFTLKNSVKENSNIINTSEERKKDPSDLSSCGICLLDEVEDRGILDSCDHLFCFSCIMDWAKVESKCPMCKRRFSEVQRREEGQLSSSTNDGKTQIYQIPLKDQKYVPTEDEIIDALEPYRYVACMVCSGQSHEELLLLCDSCDSGAHTFCVGLAYTVPEGHWLCPSCTGQDVFVTPIETPQNQRRTTASAPRGRRASSGNVRSRLESRLGAARAIRSQHGRRRRVTESLENPFRGLGAAISAAVASRPTLRRAPPQRGNARSVNSVNEELQHLRDNWEDLRRGHLDFSSRQTGRRESCRQNQTASGLQQSSGSPSGRRLDSESSGLAEHVRSEEMSQIWRMLEQARALRSSTVRLNRSGSRSTVLSEPQNTPASVGSSADGRGRSPTMPLLSPNRDREQNRRVNITRARHQLDWGGSSRAPRATVSRGDVPPNQLSTVNVLASSGIPEDNYSGHGYSSGGGMAVTSVESSKRELGSPLAPATETQGKLVRKSEENEWKDHLQVRKTCNHVPSEAAAVSTSAPTLEESQRNSDGHTASSSQQCSLYKQDQSKVPELHSENGSRILHGELFRGEHFMSEHSRPKQSNIFHETPWEVKKGEKRDSCVENDQGRNSLTNECHQQNSLVASDIYRKDVLSQPSVGLLSEEKNPKTVHSPPEVHTVASLAVQDTGPGAGLKQKGKKMESTNRETSENLRKEMICAKIDSNLVSTSSEQKPEYCKKDRKGRNRLSVPLTESDNMKAKAHKNAVAQKVKDCLQPTYSSGQIDREQFKTIAQQVTHSMMCVYKSGKCSHLGGRTQQENCPKTICSDCLQHYVESAAIDVCGIVPATLQIS